MIVTKKKEERHEIGIKMPAVLTLQIWDNDSFTPDDFLGTLNINLTHFQRPSLTADKCLLNRKENNYENLFAITEGSLRGWFPLRGKSDDNISIKQTVSHFLCNCKYFLMNKNIKQGKLEIELQVLSEEKARKDPAGKAREQPQKLSAPE